MTDPYDELADRLTGGGPVNSGQQAISGTTLSEILARKGAVSEIRPVGASTIKDEYGRVVPNPELVYEYRFADKTYVRVRARDSYVLGGTANIPDSSTPEKELADKAKAAYDQRAYEEKLRELGLYGLEGRPKGISPAEQAKAAYDEEAYKRKLQELEMYGLEGMPKPAAPRYPSIQLKGRSAYSVDPYTNQFTKVFDFPEEEMTPYQQAALEQQQETSRLAALKADQDREANNMRQAMTNYTSAWNQALAYQLPEGTEYLPNFEPGGAYDQLMSRYGTTTTPLRATRVPFDPWRAALNMKPGG